MAKRIAHPGLAAYVVTSPVNLGDEVIGIGSPIKLETKQAQALLDAESIDFADGTEVPPLVTTPNQALDQEQNKLMAELQSRGEALQASEDQRAQLQQTVAELRASAESARIAAAGAVEALQADLAGEKQKVTDLEAANQKLRDDQAAAAQAHAAELEKLNKQLTDAATKATATTAKATAGNKRG